MCGPGIYLGLRSYHYFLVLEAPGLGSWFLESEKRRDAKTFGITGRSRYRQLEGASSSMFPTKHSGLRLSCLRDGPTFIFPLHFSAPRGDPEGSSLVLRQVAGEPHRATKKQNQSVWGRSCHWAWALFFGTALRAPIVYSPFQEVSTVLDIGSWSLICFSLPSALTAALFHQWLSGPELCSSKLGLQSL